MVSPALKEQATGPFPFPWAEYIARNGVAQAGMSLAYGQTDALVLLDFNFEDFNTITLAGVGQLCLGSAVYNAATGSGTHGTISRTLPPNHPIYPQLWCNKVDKVEFYSPDQKFSPFAGNVNSPGLNYMGWNRCRLTLHFASLDYVVLSDNELQSQFNGDESQRFVSGPYIDYNLIGVQRQPGAGQGFQWGADAPAALAGKYLTQGVTQYVATYRVKWTWRLVPEKAVMDQFGFAANISECFGHVNSATFKGYPAGTLLMQKPALRQVPAPFPLDENFNHPQRLWDAEITADYNPNGWNKVPTPLGGVATIQTPDGKGLYPTIDFNTYLFVPL